MWKYSLDLVDHEGNRYVPSHDFPGPIGIGDQFDYDGRSYEVVAVAIKQFKPDPGEATRTLRCRIV